MTIVRIAGGSGPVPLDREIVEALIRERIADVQPAPGGLWSISNVRRIGSIRVGEDQLDIAPKTPIGSLSFLLGYDGDPRSWRDETVVGAVAPSVASAIAHALSQHVRRSTDGGLLRGYRDHASAEYTVRGRWDIANQIDRGRGLPLPVHLHLDEFDADIDENRILLAALRRALRWDRVDPAVRSRLRALLRRFDGVAPTGARAAAPPITRLNRHYRPALEIAELVLRGGSIEAGGSSIASAGALVDLDAVFERFLRATIADAALRRGLRATKPAKRDFDDDGAVSFQPDIVISAERHPIAVVDAKHKVLRSARFPNADIYQAIAYARWHGLDAAHLVYAKGESEARSLRVSRAGVVVHVHAVDLTLMPPALLESIDRLTARIVGHAPDGK